ncbi:MAG: ATP phosphoribosyltransferase [Candidatus Neomarinimicrobiota bacterium]
MEAILRIALQKSGRLNERSQSLLRECGIDLSNGHSRLKARASNFPLDVLFLRDDDIPQYVADRVADVGILGENVVAEKGRPVRVVEPLGFARCRLSLAIRHEDEYSGTAWFSGKKIATSYPNILNRHLLAAGVSAAVEEISGSVEIAPGIGLADGICDIVSSGSTLFSNGLKEVETVMESQAVLIANPELSPAKQALLDKLVFRIRAARNARDNKYILLNAPNSALENICRILPGMKSPTVLPLAEAGWSSIHSVVREEKFWEVIDQLKDLGAQGILVIPIEKMVV